MKKLFSKAEGFTLIELMVVVAIIGVLSAIAVPNFKKYQAKAKQSEAKIQLAAIYSTEVGAIADFDSYGTCLGDLGYEATPRGYYLVGFTTANVANIAARGTTCSSPAFLPPSITHLKSGTTVPVVGTLPANSTTATTFTAGAAGNISAALYDKWTITDTKSLTNALVGY
jgi:type IV pilus assembly protein PilA